MQKDFSHDLLEQIASDSICCGLCLDHTLHGEYMRISNCYASLRREKDKLSFLEAHEHLSSKIQVQVLHLSTEVRNMLRSFFFLSQVLFATYRQFWEAESKRSLHIAGGVFDLILKFLLIPQNCILSSVNQNPGSLGNLVCPRIHWRTRIANGGVQENGPVAKVFGAKQVYLLDIMASAYKRYMLGLHTQITMYCKVKLLQLYFRDVSWSILTTENDQSPNNRSPLNPVWT